MQSCKQEQSFGSWKRKECLGPTFITSTADPLLTSTQQPSNQAGQQIIQQQHLEEEAQKVWLEAEGHWLWMLSLIWQLQLHPFHIVWLVPVEYLQPW